MNVVVDTNVAIAANGRNTHACYRCQLNCVGFLEGLVAPNARRKVAVDTCGFIFQEYMSHLNFQGQPGVGDAFFKHLHNHMYVAGRVLQVLVTPINDVDRDFEELPTNSLDRSDRKFLATAIAGKAEIVNALDSDWHQQRDLLFRLKVKMKQLCPEHACVT